MEISSVKTQKKPAFAFRLWRGPLPSHLVDSLKDAVKAMYAESYVDHYLTEKGFTDNTWEQIIAAMAGNGIGEFWLALQDGQVVGYLLGQYSKEVDNEPTYVIRQAWSHKMFRRTPKVKEALGTVLYNAKSNLAKHVLIVSSRNPKAYMRWLGPGWVPVSTILKGDL